MSGWERIAGSLGLDASELDDLRPLRGFIGAERSEIREARFIIAGREAYILFLPRQSYRTTARRSVLAVSSTHFCFIYALNQ